MEWLTPEAIGTAGVSLGTAALLAFLKLVGRIGTLVDQFSKGMDSLHAMSKRSQTHYEIEEKYQRSVLEYLSGILQKSSQNESPNEASRR